MATPECSDVIEEDPNKLGGTPVLKGTRVPVRILYEYLEAGDSLDRFLEHYPTVNKQQAKFVLNLSREELLGSTNRDAA